MRSRALLLSTGVLLSAVGLFALAPGCTGSGDDLFQHGGGPTTSSSSDGGGGGGGTSNGGNAGHGAGAQGGGGQGAEAGTGPGGGGTGPGGGGSGGAGAQGGQGGGVVDPCPSACGVQELCDGVHAGIDDDCDGAVDESCSCVPGLAQACFKGNPSYRDDPGCFAGTQHCTDAGTWGQCVGGVHANEQCWVVSSGCHAISGLPLVPVNLKDGTGNFSDDAITESWTVECPPGAAACPGVLGSNPADDFQPLQSGEYKVHYQKTTSNSVAQCDYSLFVRDVGLRVELDWEHGVLGPSDTGVDIDLHLHEPNETSPWFGNPGTARVCGWSNCTVSHYNPQAPELGAPDWFDGLAPPDPVDWYEDPVFAHNTCYYAPRGLGQQWQTWANGCHNPRLELDNITCNPTELDPNAQDFCAPENTNVDYPPEGEWFRIGVHYYSSHGATYSVHPRVLVYCGGALAAELGPAGYDEPVLFAPADGQQGPNARFWLVADVRFGGDGCNPFACEVRPLYEDPQTRSAMLSTASEATQSFGPPYPQ